MKDGWSLYIFEKFGITAEIYYTHFIYKVKLVQDKEFLAPDYTRSCVWTWKIEQNRLVKV